jgi:peptide/nickel transport system permease protein
MSKGYIKTAQLQGVPASRILFVHMLPNMAAMLASSAIIAFSNAMLAEASLSYLGLGIQPPYPSWGRMLAESYPYLRNAPWCAAAPGLFIVFCVMALQAAGGSIQNGNRA